MADLPTRRRPQRILVVDDNPDNIFLTRELLGSRGYDVNTATSAEAAAAAIRSQHPDLILLDVVMPGMNGFEACRRIREKTSSQNVPIIMVTTRGEERNVETGFQSGCSDYILKPINGAELLGKVRSYLGS